MALVKSELYLALKAAGVSHELASAAATAEEPGTRGSPLQKVEASIQTIKMMLAFNFGLILLILIAIVPR